MSRATHLQAALSALLARPPPPLLRVHVAWQEGRKRQKREALLVPVPVRRRGQGSRPARDYSITDGRGTGEPPAERTGSDHNEGQKREPPRDDLVLRLAAYGRLQSSKCAAWLPRLGRRPVASS